MLPRHFPAINVGFLIGVYACINIVIRGAISSWHTRDGLGRRINAGFIREAREDEVANIRIGSRHAELIDCRFVKRTESRVGQIWEEHDVFLFS